MGIIAMGAHSEMREKRRRAAIVTAQNPFIVREKFVSSVPPTRHRTHLVPGFNFKSNLTAYKMDMPILNVIYRKMLVDFYLTQQYNL